MENIHGGHRDRMRSRYLQARMALPTMSFWKCSYMAVFPEGTQTPLHICY